MNIQRGFTLVELILVMVVIGILAAVAGPRFFSREVFDERVYFEEALAAAGFPDIPVGTVDRFQGQEAAVAIVSLAASAGRDAPRGLEFLLLRNRLNVAISRAKHTAYLVHSPALLDDLPYTPEGVARLSGFARLVGRG